MSYDPWEDKSLIEAFIEGEWQSVVEWCEDRNLNPNSLDNWIEYCNFYERAFLEFMAEYASDLEALTGEQSWELNEDR